MGDMIFLFLHYKGHLLELSAESGVSTSVCHLQAHVSSLLIHMSDHASTQFGFGCQVVSYSGFALSPFSQLKHDINVRTSDFNYEQAGTETSVQYTHTSGSGQYLLHTSIQVGLSLGPRQCDVIVSSLIHRSVMLPSVGSVLIVSF